MNDVIKTGAFVGVAALLTVLATMTGPRATSLELYKDEGELFFPDFKDAAAAAELDVVEYRESAGGAFPFAVKRDEKGRWTIPSHFDYAADAKDRMGKAAALLIGLKKDAVQGDEKGRHVDFGVVDPLDASTETKGRGTRITLKDSGGNALADLILGNEVDGKPGWRYVRQPDKKRVYRTKIDGEVSTKFADWIETDLLKASSYDIDQVTFDNYTINENARSLKEAIVHGDKIEVSKDAAGKWSLAGLDAQKEEPNEEKLREIGDTLSKIKIVGVRPKPEGLTARLERANGREARALAQELVPRGYYLVAGEKVYSNEGDLLFATKKGVRYTLRFGNLVVGEGEEVSAGVVKKPKEGEAPKAEKPANNRYLMVTVEFDESLLKKPTGEHLPQDQLDKRAEARQQIEAMQRAIETFRSKNENKLPESLAKLAEKPAAGEPLLAELKKDPWGNDYQLQVSGENYTVLSFADGGTADGTGAAADVRSDRLPFEDELKKQATEWSDYEKKVKDGQDEAAKLTKRFGPWYYVIDQELFGKLKPKRADLVKPKAEKPAEPPAPHGDVTLPGK